MQNVLEAEVIKNFMFPFLEWHNMKDFRDFLSAALLIKPLSGSQRQDTAHLSLRDSRCRRSWKTTQFKRGYQLRFLFASLRRSVLLGSNNICAPRSTGKLQRLGPRPGNTRGISKPNNGCFCFLHLLLCTDVHLYLSFPFIWELWFLCLELTLHLFNSPTSSVAATQTGRYFHRKSFGKY